jgi:hypothetical protein
MKTNFRNTIVYQELNTRIPKLMPYTKRTSKRLARRVINKSPPAVVGFLDRNYHYKSVATQILHDTGLTPIHPAGERTQNTACEAVIVSLLQSGGHTLMCI